MFILLVFIWVNLFDLIGLVFREGVVFGNFRIYIYVDDFFKYFVFLVF